MKKYVFMCCALLAMGVFVLAGQQILTGRTDEPLTSAQPVGAIAPVTLPDNAAAASDMKSPEAEMVDIAAQLEAARDAGIEPSAALTARYDQLTSLLRQNRDHGTLDQGAETCATATVIPTADPVAFCESGIMGETDDCTIYSFTYRDVFYQFTPATTGLYVVTTCGSIGNTDMYIWANTCCSGTYFATDNDSCYGSDSRRRLTLTAGTTYFFEIGYHYSDQVADAYNFNLFGPLPATPPAPPNDVCASAIVLTSFPAIVSGTTWGSANETQPSCGGTGNSYGGVYYSITGTGNYFTAGNDNNCSTFDSRIRVYSGSCTALTCVGGNDNANGTTGLSSFTWCTEPNVTYFIIVSVYNSSTNYRGPFTLQVTEGAPCSCTLFSTCSTPPETEPNGTCALPDVNEIGCNDSLFAVHCPEADSDWFQIRIPPLTTMTVTVSEGANCGTYPLTTLWTKIVGTSCTNTLSSSSTTARIITNSQAAADSIIYMLVYQSTATRTSYKIITSCRSYVDCSTYYPCGTPVEVEPNNACVDAPFSSVGACGESVYGTICSATDVDYWYVPATAPLQRLTVSVFDGDNCDTYPAANVGVRLATNSSMQCAAPSGSFYSGLTFGGPDCQAWTGGYIAVAGAGGGLEYKYKLVTTCENVEPPACPNVQLPKQFCAGPCVGPIVGNNTVAYFIDVPMNEIIDDLNLRVNITHYYDSDIQMFLVTPWEATIEISTGNGGSGDNYQVTLFDDEAACLISDPGCAVAPFNGSYRPEQPLSSADGQMTGGTYTLLITDNYPTSAGGYVNCWCLEFTSHAPCTADQQVMLNPSDPSFPSPQSVYACAHLAAGTNTQLVVPVHNATNTPNVTVSSGCSVDGQCYDPSCEPLTAWVMGDWAYFDNPPRYENTITAAPGATGCCVCLHLDYVLPVQLENFTAVAGDRSVTLNWNTASETYTDRFELARDGEKIADVASQGSSGSGAAYSWVDRNLENGTRYTYTLSAVDVNGVRSTLRTLEATPVAPLVITEYALHQNYPNPFNPTTSITFDLVDAGFVTLRVYNLMGQEAATLVNANLASGRHTVTFDASSLPSGIYLYQVTANHFTATQKMMLMK